jgi:hypothetical protein
MKMPAGTQMEAHPEPDLRRKFGKKGEIFGLIWGKQAVLPFLAKKEK